MTAKKKVRMITDVQKRCLWAATHSHGLNEDILYSTIESVSGQNSMRALTYVEAAKVLDRLNGNSVDEAVYTQKRTDDGGNPKTIPLRKKIYRLTGLLGWNDNNNRINGFVKKNFKVERIEWLSVAQCHKLIEMLKKMIIRQGGNPDEWEGDEIERKSN